MTTYRFKGRGYHTRHMTESATRPGFYSIPMYRNRDDAMLGTKYIQASSPRQAFEQARKECWEDFTRNS